MNRNDSQIRVNFWELVDGFVKPLVDYLHCGLRCVCLPSPIPGAGGIGNGYVLVPTDHPYHGEAYYGNPALEAIIVHGGITFSAPTVGGTWFGFDTLHGDDENQGWDLDKLMEETNKLAEQLAVASETCLGDGNDG